MQQKPITIQPLTIQPLEDQSKKLEIKPLEVQPLETEQKSEDRSWLGKAWDYITDGAWQGPTGGEKVFDKLNRIRRTYSALSSPFPQVANDPQFGDKPLDRTGVTYNQILSGLQNSQLSPGNLALFAATGGASMAAKMGIPVVATGLNLIGRAAGAGFAYQGAKSMMDEDKGPVERVLGGAQAGLGLFAAAHETPKGTQPKIEPKVETPVVEPKIELNPEVTGLKIRIARAEDFLKRTDITETERLVNQANLERLQGRLKEVETGDFSASQAAQEVRSAEVRDIVKENIGKGGKPVFNRDQDVLQIQPLDKATIGPDIEPPINTWSLAEVRQATLDNDPIKASAATQELASRKAAFDASVDNLKEAGYEPVKSPTRGAIFIDEQGNTVRINPVTQSIEPLEADFAAGGVPPARELVNKFKSMSDEELNGLLESKNPELVKNAVAELHDRYGATQEQPIKSRFGIFKISDIMDEIKTQASNRAKGIDLVETLPRIPVASNNARPFLLYDVGNRLTPEEVTFFQADPAVNNLSTTISSLTHDINNIVHDLTTRAKLDKIGLLLEDETRGVNIPNGKGQASVFINPFAIMTRRAPQNASSGILHTIMHETVHNGARNHTLGEALKLEGEDFTVLLADAYEKLGDEAYVNALDRIRRSILSPDGYYTPEVQEVLQRYREASGRAATTTDPNFREGIRSRIKKPREGEIPESNKSDGTGTTPPRRFLDAIKTAIAQRNEQTEIYRTEKGRRAARAEKINVTDKESYYKFKGKFAGKYSKVAAEPVKLAEADVSSMISSIHKAPLNVFQKMNATDGLLKIINGSEVPNKYELNLLGEVFGKEFSNELGTISVDMLTAPVRGLPKAWNLLGIEMQALPKTLMSVWDTSAFLRQGIGLIHTKAAWKAFPSLFRNFTSQEFFDGTMKAIEGSKHYDLSQNKNVGLKLTDLGSNYRNNEEAFMSRLAENYLPGVKASERSFVGYLDKVRSDTFNKMVDQQIDVAMGDLNLDPRYNLDVAKRIADYVNTASGRGSLPHIKGLGLDIELERSAVALNSILFSPRLIASRIQMLNPINYVKGPALVRRAYLKSALAIAGGGSIFANMAQLALGDRADVGNISTSSDYGKLRIGNTRIDPFAGFQQYIVLFNRLTQNETTASTSGRTFELGSHYGAATRTDLIEQFIVQKFAPINQLAYLLLQGKMPNGAPIDMQSEIAKRFIPLLFQDIYELSQDDPDLIPVAIPLAALGMGVQTYQPAKSARQNLLSNVNR